MNNSTKKFLFFILALQPLLIVSVWTFYRYGIQEYGEPAEYYVKQQEMLKVMEDSLRAQLSVISPENVGDSTLVGLDMHTMIFEESQNYEKQISTMHTTLDSLQQEKATLEEISKEVARQQAILNDLRTRALDEKITDLAKIYDGMKPQQSLPLFIVMEDTLAVMIISNMQERNAARLLGAMAASDINKATRINKLLAMMGAISLQQ